MCLLVISSACLLNACSFTSSMHQSKSFSCERSLRGISIALESYSLDNSGNYPDSLQRMCPRYMKEIPRCPASNREYAYIVNRNHGTFTIVCEGWAHRKDLQPLGQEKVGENNIVYSRTKDSIMLMREPVPAK
jgi:hypothetical protein